MRNFVHVVEKPYYFFFFSFDSLKVKGTLTSPDSNCKSLHVVKSKQLLPLTSNFHSRKLSILLGKQKLHVRNNFVVFIGRFYLLIISMLPQKIPLSLNFASKFRSISVVLKKNVAVIDAMITCAFCKQLIIFFSCASVSTALMHCRYGTCKADNRYSENLLRVYFILLYCGQVCMNKSCLFLLKNSYISLMFAF